MKVRTKQTLLSLGLVFLGGAILAYLLSHPRRAEEKRSRPPPPLVRVRVAHPETHRVSVSSQGTVSPRTRSALVPEVSGRVVEVGPSWAEGAFFEKGEVLFEIDESDYEFALVNAEAELARAELRLTQEEEEAAVARREWESLGGEDSSEPSPLVLRKPQLKEARAALEAARSRVRQARLDLERTRVRAPYAGRVLEKQIDFGQYVTRGSTAARIYAVDYAEVELPVPTDELAYLDLPLHYRGDERLREGPEVLLSAEFAGETHTWKGTIVRTEGEIDPRSRMIHLIARVDDPYGRGEDPDRPPLAIGLFVRAEILGRRLEDVFLLPRHALRSKGKVLVVEETRASDEATEAMAPSREGLAGTGTEDGGTAAASRASAPAVTHAAGAPVRHGRLRFREVEVLRREDDRIVIRRGRTSGPGLLPGELVCLSPLGVVVDNMRVRFLEEAGKETGLFETSPPESAGATGNSSVPAAPRDPPEVMR